MPSERALGLLLLGLALAGCDEKKEGPAPDRFEGVKKSSSLVASHFCEKSYPGSGDGVKKFEWPPLQPFGDEVPKVTQGWTWVNVWATWCNPCVEEMGLLEKWKDASAREGLVVSWRLLSIDEEDAKDKLDGWKAKNLPGPILWLKSQDDFGPFLEGLGVDKSAAIPIHVLVDPKGDVRCVRVGAIHDQNWGAVKDLLSEG